jgi:hypothetical protein
MADRPTRPAPKPAPKLQATRTRPAELVGGDEHEERVIDEAADESFPASDPPAIANPGGSLAVKHMARDGRKVPGPDAARLGKKK